MERRASVAGGAPGGGMPPSLTWIRECEDSLVGIVPNGFLDAMSVARMLGVEDPDRLIDIARGSPASSPLNSRSGTPGIGEMPALGTGARTGAEARSGSGGRDSPSQGMSPRQSVMQGDMPGTPPSGPLLPPRRKHDSTARKLRGADAQGLPALGLLEAASAQPSVSLCRRGVAAIVGALCLVSSNEWPQFCAAVAPSPGRRLRFELRILRLALTLLALPPFPGSWIRL